jgi:hypothetical protein
MEPEDSLPCSHKPATGPYPEPAASSSPHFPLLRSCQRISPGPRRVEKFRNNKNFLRWGVVSPTPNPQAGGPPFVGCPRLLIQYILSYPS